MEKQSIESGFTLRWLFHAALGILLVVLLAVHLTVNHWVAPHGLLTYPDIVHYYDHPLIIGMESIFLIVVVLHCGLGLHSILLDLNAGENVTNIVTNFLLLLCMIAIVYGLWLIRIIASLSA